MSDGAGLWICRFGIRNVGCKVLDAGLSTSAFRAPIGALVGFEMLAVGFGVWDVGFWTSGVETSFLE